MEYLEKGYFEIIYSIERRTWKGTFDHHILPFTQNNIRLCILEKTELENANDLAFSTT